MQVGWVWVWVELDPQDILIGIGMVCVSDTMEPSNQ